MAEAQPTVAFKDIPGFPGYRVGDDGSVWKSLDRHGFPDPSWKRLSVKSKTSKGYPMIRLRLGAGLRSVTVHRLVLTAFVGPRPAGMQCCHCDGNPLNNRLSNLRWDTPSANQMDRVVHGTSNRGERCGASKLTAADVSEIRRRAAEGVATYKQIGAMYGIGGIQVSRIVKRERWAHLA